MYKNKKVLISGHTGFKGSWLTIWLLRLGADVTGYALNPKTQRNNFVLCGLENLIKDYREDIRNFNKLNEVLGKVKPEIIFHLAAQPLVIESYHNPHYTIETNTQGTANILEAFRQSDSAKVLIVITTDKVYKNNEWERGYKETDILGGVDPYSASKSAAELLVTAYQKSFFCDNNKLLVSVRAGNVIGGGDWAENRIIPDCMKAIERNEKIIIRNPNSTRPWQHVLEPLGGYMLLGEKLLLRNSELIGAWNFGPLMSNVINVEDLVKHFIQAFGRGEYSIANVSNARAETNFLSLDITKAIKKLNWNPLLNIDETIDLTVDWYKNYNSLNLFDLCNRQIEQYEQKWKLKKEN